MSEPIEPVLSPAEQAELRHELRTPFNHVIGYTEMLLESAAEDGLEPLVPGLKLLHTDARELLNAVNAGLTADRPVKRADLVTLARTLSSGVSPLTLLVCELLERARHGAHEVAFNDLARIRRSIDDLACLTSERLLGGPVAPTRATKTSVEPVAPPCSLAPTTGRAWGVILVVDDNETNRDLLCRRLEREGFTAVPATDGRQALEMLGNGTYDLVLLDIVMPEVDGYEVLRVIKGTASLRDIPVVMISALDEMSSVVRCIEMGAEDFLPKPFDPVLLRARVGASLDKKRLRDRELEYLRGVGLLEEAASAVEAGQFDPRRLEKVAGREDELGKLARVFERMATEVQAREQRLKQQVAQLRIEIDMVRLTKQVEEVVADPMFDSLKGARGRLRRGQQGTS